MTPQQMREILEQSLADQRLSRGKKSVLSQHLDEAGADAEQLAHFRQLAFGLAREAVDATNGTLIVEWLEEIAKVLQPSAGGGVAGAGVALDEAPGFRETLQPRPPDAYEVPEAPFSRPDCA